MILSGQIGMVTILIICPQAITRPGIITVMDHTVIMAIIGETTCQILITNIELTRQCIRAVTKANAALHLEQEIQVVEDRLLEFIIRLREEIITPD